MRKINKKGMVGVGVVAHMVKMPLPLYVYNVLG